MKQAFGAMLRETRTAAGWTLEALAAAIGVSTVYLSRVELGKTPPPTEARTRDIARALGVSPYRLLRADVVGRGCVATPQHETGQRVAALMAAGLDEEAFRVALLRLLLPPEVSDGK